ncbi:MAG: ArsB/NhaD family transporter [Kofleriaceae bacterium]
MLAVVAIVVALVVALAWRSAWAPALGAAIGVTLAVAGGTANVRDLGHAAGDLWRPLITIVGIMVTTACAAEVGIFARLAAWIEPRTRGPTRHAFRWVFGLSAVTAALLSNDAAILLLTPVIVELLRAVYPKRHVKFVLPFAFAVFVAAGVAPLPTGNPMNLVLAHRTGISFNNYALHMIPVALIGWLIAYRCLAWCFRDVLADDEPAKGEAPAFEPLGGHAKLILAVTGASIVSYPLLAAVHSPMWPVAAIAAALCVATALHRKVTLRAISLGVSWELVPFLFGILVLATTLARAGVTDSLASIYSATPAPLASVGVISALGSAVIGNHAMALLSSIALAEHSDAQVFAAMIGGDLGPRLLPIGSLAGLLWTHALRRQGVRVSLRTFVTIGVIVTIPTLVASLATLWLVVRL